jgi:hypothetical protein
MFQMADTWCDTIDVQEHVDYLNWLYSKMFQAPKQWRKLKAMQFLFSAKKYKRFDPKEAWSKMKRLTRLVGSVKVSAAKAAAIKAAALEAAAADEAANQHPHTQGHTFASKWTITLPGRHNLYNGSGCERAAGSWLDARHGADSHYYYREPDAWGGRHTRGKATGMYNGSLVGRWDHIGETVGTGGDAPVVTSNVSAEPSSADRWQKAKASAEMQEMSRKKSKRQAGRQQPDRQQPGLQSGLQPGRQPEQQAHPTQSMASSEASSEEEWQFGQRGMPEAPRVYVRGSSHGGKLGRKNADEPLTPNRRCTVDLSASRAGFSRAGFSSKPASMSAIPDVQENGLPVGSQAVQGALSLTAPAPPQPSSGQHSLSWPLALTPSWGSKDSGLHERGGKQARGGSRGTSLATAGQLPRERHALRPAPAAHPCANNPQSTLDAISALTQVKSRLAAVPSGQPAYEVFHNYAEMIKLLEFGLALCPITGYMEARLRDIMQRVEYDETAVGSAIRLLGSIITTLKERWQESDRLVHSMPESENGGLLWGRRGSTATEMGPITDRWAATEHGCGGAWELTVTDIEPQRPIKLPPKKSAAPRTKVGWGGAGPAGGYLLPRSAEDFAWEPSAAPPRRQLKAATSRM